jgi:hypothetical protein
MRPLQQRCAYCNAPATLLCDFQLGMPVPSYASNGDLRRAHTCDLPTCRAHAQHRGNIHVRLTQRVNGRRGYFETIDYCLEHASSHPWRSQHIRDCDAEQMRREIRATAHRRAVDELGLHPDALPATIDQEELF